MSDVPARTQARSRWMRGQLGSSGARMRGTVGALQTADGPAAGSASARGLGGRALSWPSLVVAALLSVALGAGLYVGLAGGRTSVVAGARLRPSSHLRPGTSPQKKGLSSLPLAAQGPISQTLGADSPA